MSRPARLLALMIAVIAALLVAVAGCGGGGGENRAAGLEAQEVLAQSADAWTGLTSFRLAFEVAGTADLGPEVGRLLGDAIDVTGEGVVRPPDATAIDATVRVAGLPLQIGLTRRADQVVLSALGRDVGIEVDRSTLAFLDFSAAYPELVGWIATPELADGERIDGTDTVAVSGPVDPARALAALRPLLGSDAPAPGEVSGFSGTATVWVGVTDLVPRRIALSLRGDAGGIAAEAGALDISATGNISQVDSAGEVVLPQADTRLRPDQLGSLIGG